MIDTRQAKRVYFAFILTVFFACLGSDSQAAQPPDLSDYPWLYLRDDKALEAKEEVIELVAVGDVMLGRGVAAEADPFANVSSWLNAADLTLGNLETVIVWPERPPPNYDVGTGGPLYNLQASPLALAKLREAGFDLLGLANNHALDLGPSGLAGTVAHLKTIGLTTLGAGPDIKAAAQPLIRQVGPVRLAFLAFNAVRDPTGKADEADWQPGSWHQEEATAAITSVRDQVDVVIVSIHWGYEYQTQVDPAQRVAARTMFEAGADIIIGHHPHVVQEVELAPDLDGPNLQAGKLVAYSLGNFVFDQSRENTNQGLALRTFFDRQGVRAVQAVPVWAGPHPRLMTPVEAESLLARLRPVPRRLGFSCNGQSCRMMEHIPPALQTGLFWGGEIDLTGDGRPEKIRRMGCQVVIYQAGQAVWRSHPDWQVLDLALGDPNDDGRWEAMLALTKPDQTGQLRSHPFIIGYRRGIYRDLWGGSAVVNPIAELELGDVDGDGSQELVVLESSTNSLEQSVSVWDWHGWGFSLRWRSPPGAYRDLVFTPGTADYLPFISVMAHQ